jgi:hypothetical protein
VAAVQRAHRGDGNGDVASSGDVASEQAHPGRQAFLDEAVGEIEYPAQRQIGWCREANQQASRSGADRFDVGDVDRNRLTPDIACFGPVTSKVDALNEDIHRSRHRISDGEYGRIVPRANPYIWR